jgi:hypothetical protein
MTTVITILTLWAASQQSPAPRETLRAGGTTPMQVAEPSNEEKSRILIRLSESPSVQHGKVAYDKQSESQRVFSAIWGLEAEVNNGGFRQYFFNSASEAAPDAPAALRAIGAHRAAAIVADALARFPQGPPPRDRAARQRRLRLASPEVLAAWEQLDRQFFTYPDNLTDLLYAWVKSRPNDFGAIP